MLKKVFKIWIGFVFVAFLSVVVTSCCRPKNVKICGLEMTTNLYANSSSNLLALNSNPDDGIDTSVGQFDFNLVGNNIFEEDVCYLSTPFITVAHAFQPCENNLLDSIPRANISLSLDRAITFNSQTILAGENLLTNAISATYINYTYNNYGVYEGRLFIDPVNFPLMQLDTGLYTLTTAATTASGHIAVLSNKVVFQY